MLRGGKHHKQWVHRGQKHPQNCNPGRLAQETALRFHMLVNQTGPEWGLDLAIGDQVRIKSGLHTAKKGIPRVALGDPFCTEETLLPDGGLGLGKSVPNPVSAAWWRPDAGRQPAI